MLYCRTLSKHSHMVNIMFCYTPVLGDLSAHDFNNNFVIYSYPGRENKDLEQNFIHLHIILVKNPSGSESSRFVLPHLVVAW